MLTGGCIMKRIVVLLCTFIMILLSGCSGIMGDIIGNKSNSGLSVLPSVGDILGKETKLATDTTIAEQVIFDDKNIKITATKLEFKNNSPILSLKFDNNTDKKVEFLAGTLACALNAVNGYFVTSGYLSTTIESGKSANETIRFNPDELKIFGIEEIADIEVAFAVRDATKREDMFETDPLKIVTSCHDKHDYSVDSYLNAVKNNAFPQGTKVDKVTEDNSFDENGVKSVSQAIIINPQGEHSLALEFCNTSSGLLHVKAGDVSLNGLTLDSFKSDSISLNAGNKGVIALSMESIAGVPLSDLDIESLGEIEATITIYDKNANKISERRIKYQAGNAGAVKLSGKEVYNENGITIYAKNPTRKGENGDIHILLMIANGSEKDINMDLVYKSLSINNIMLDEYSSKQEIGKGKNGLYNIQIQNSSASKNGISDVTSIKEVSFSLEIKDKNYNKIASPKINWTY